MDQGLASTATIGAMDGHIVVTTTPTNSTVSTCMMMMVIRVMVMVVRGLNEDEVSVRVEEREMRMDLMSLFSSMSHYTIKLCIFSGVDPDLPFLRWGVRCSREGVQVPQHTLSSRC